VTWHSTWRSVGNVRKYTISETKIVPENGWLEDDLRHMFAKRTRL